MPSDTLIKRLEKVAHTDAHEGPVYAPDEHALYFTSVPAPQVAIRRLDLFTSVVTTLVEDANAANGMTLGADGRLVVCEQDPPAIARIDRRTGAREAVVEEAGLNSPNDVVERSDGTIWFTDPSYGWLQSFRPAPELPDAVYCFDPVSSEIDCVADSFDHPNGLAFSPDESVLYVGDSGEPHHVKAYDVVDGRTLANERVFAVIQRGYPDGLKTDAHGHVYISSLAGVQVFDPDGMPLDLIPVRDSVNFAFAGDALLITNDIAIWKADLKWMQ
jgi:gluconolactonase